MIIRVEALRFRSLKDVSKPIASFQLLVGPNASGKSSFLDVVGFIRDLLRAGPLRAILGDSKAGVASRAADPSHLCWMRQGDRFELAVEMRIPADRAPAGNGKYARARYEVGVQTGANGTETMLAGETLWIAPEREQHAEIVQRRLFPESTESRPTLLQRQAPKGWRPVVRKTAENDYFRAETSDWNTLFKLGPSKSALANLPEDENRFPVATWVKRLLLDGIQQVILNAESMRRPSPPGAPSRFLPDGSNLPWVIENLRQDPDRFTRWIEHVRTVLPDLDTVKTVERPEDRHRYLILKYFSGLEASSWVVSDGTLRLLALTLLPYLPDRDVVYLIEEPENGIHPRAVEAVYQSLSAVQESQILCASHSPVVLKMARLEDILCFAKTPDGATDVVRGTEHPALKNWKGSLDLGTLFATGVLG